MAARISCSGAAQNHDNSSGTVTSPCFKRAIDNMFEPVEQLVEGNEGQSGRLDPGQSEVIAKEGCVALNGFSLSSPC